MHTELPALTGSAKQIAWADSIRSRWLDNAGDLTDAVAAVLAHVTRSSSIIDARRCDAVVGAARSALPLTCPSVSDSVAGVRSWAKGFGGDLDYGFADLRTELSLETSDVELIEAVIALLRAALDSSTGAGLTVPAERICAVERLGCRLWGSGADQRAYMPLQEIAERMGLNVGYYKTGNVAAASWGGERISNTRAREVLQALQQAAVWADLLTGEVHTRTASHPIAAAVVAEAEAGLRAAMRDPGAAVALVDAGLDYQEVAETVELLAA